MSFENFTYSVRLDTRGRKCLVAGGGKVALRKSASLLKSGACVKAVAPSFISGFKELSPVPPASLTLLEREFVLEDVKGAFIVIAATDDPKVNARVAEEAKKEHCLVNVADDPAAGNFSVSGTVDLSGVNFAVNSHGLPRLTHLILEDLKKTYGPALDGFAPYLDKMREKMQKDLPDSNDRLQFWRSALTEEVLELIKDGQTEKAKEIIENAAAGYRSQS